MTRPAEDLPLSIAQQFDDFSGFYCKDGDLLVGATASAAEDEIQGILSLVRAEGISFYCQNRDFPGHDPQIIPVQQRYSFLQLRLWRENIIEQYYSTNSGRGLGIDYEKNQIVLDVVFGAGRSHQDMIALKNIPNDAVQITERTDLVPRSCQANLYGGSLQACFRPVPGGVQLVHSAIISGTFTVPGVRASESGWVTCAHCLGTSSVGQNLGTDVYQPNASDANNFAGEEAVDPPTFSCWTYDGQYHYWSRCRYSDSAWVREFGAPTHRGQLVQTQAWNGSTGVCDTSLGPACIPSTTNPRFQVYGGGTLVQGMQVEKIGRTTGWTTSTLGQTCYDYYSTDLGIMMVCQATSNLVTDFGDSGSPVFKWWSSYGVNTVEMVGVFWAADSGVAILSPWANVTQDLGAIDIRYQPQWQFLTYQEANDIGVGANGAVWITSNTPAFYGYTIKRYNGLGGWDTIGGDAVRLAVDPSGNAWVVNNIGNIWKYNGSTWENKSAGVGAIDIGIGANGAVWIIGTAPGTGGNAIYAWNGSGWTVVSGGGWRIAVDPSGNPWVTRPDNTIWRRIGGVWQQLTGLAQDIGIGSDNMAWVIGTGAAGGGYQIWWWSGVNWVLAQGGANAISVHKGAQPFVVNSAHNIYWGP